MSETNLFPQEGKIAAILRNHLGLGPEVDMRKVRRADYAEWDSLRHVKVMLAIQAAFKIRFSGAEMLRLGSLQELCETVARKIACV